MVGMVDREYVVWREGCFYIFSNRIDMRISKC